MASIKNEPIRVEEISLFTTRGTGQGRENNDENNKRREKIIVDLYNGILTPFLQDPQHGAAWLSLYTEFMRAFVDLRTRLEIPVDVGASLVAKGGRGYNYDFLVTFDNQVEVKLEFKCGGTSIESLPEFFNAAADKPFHSEIYAQYYYRNWLPQIASLYAVSVEKPTELEYLKLVHQDKSVHPFIKALKAAEEEDGYPPKKTTGPLYKRKQELVHQSIRAFLEAQAPTTKLDTLTQEFQRSQQNKQFLLFDSGKFYHDQIKPSELIAKSVLPVRNGNLLVIQTAEPSTRVEMLLRWKNHLGILFPAWQIKMVRTIARR